MAPIDVRQKDASERTRLEQRATMCTSCMVRPGEHDEVMAGEPVRMCTECRLEWWRLW